MKKQVTNWGKHPSLEANVFTFDYFDELTSKLNTSDSLIARGNGRCYGDASLAENIVSTLRFQKVLGFDIEEGHFYCQAGMLLSEILEIIVPKGWFLPVTPGTKFITVGGAVASDVHGKNHHKEGSFSNHILELQVLCSDGNTIKCSKDVNPDLFHATCGGMGLTGIILSVKFKLKKIETVYIEQVQIKAKNLDEILDLFTQYEDHTYSMAWIDCLKGGDNFGRSIMMAGEHTLIDQLDLSKRERALEIPRKRKLNIPIDFPSAVLNSASVRIFNEFYYRKNLRKVLKSTVPYDAFFYPLDAILNWNKMYGKNGFVQYQFVLPLETGRAGLVEILDRIRKKGAGSFLAVLKLFGEQESLISFPMKGYTLALDFPVRKGLFEFLNELDQIVLKHHGRIYLSKDARMDQSTFKESYPNVQQFLDIVRKYNPHGKFASVQSKRLSII